MTRKLFAIIVAALVLIQLVLLTVFFKGNFNGSYPYHLLIEITKIVFIVVCLIAIEKFKIIYLIAGHVLILVAWLWNFVETLNFINVNTRLIEIFKFVFYDLPSVFGVAFLIYGILVALNDNSELVSKLKNLAFYDSLTNLPNRNIISKTCPITPGKQCNKKGNCACLSRREIINSSKSSTILFLDLDEFKQINDNFGHANGDILLRMVSDRIKAYVSKETEIVHLSGDEFLVIIYDLPLNEVIKQVIDLLDLMNSPFVLANKNVIVSCSVGVAQYPKDGEDINEVISKADKAMYKAKKEGKNQYFVYNQKIEAEASEIFIRVSELKASLKNDEFVLFYQPKANILTGEITGFEGLMRWNNPTRGLIKPKDFIPIAEQAGLIKEIDIIAINKACQLIEEWTLNNKPIYNISVNVSPLFFNSRFFISQVEEIIGRYNISPKYLSIEITETIALNDLERTKKKLKKLQAHNIKVFLDDFGTGYSSLAYLKEYEVDYIKIDKAFVDDLSSNLIDRTIVQAVVNVANILGVKVVGEGVESLVQLEALKEIGCHEYQGYYLSKPCDFKDLKI